MHALRNAHTLARLVLAWFVLAVGVAVASPLVAPQSLQLVCTDATSMRLLVKSVDGEELSARALHCPQCLVQVASAPPPASTPLTFSSPLSYALQPQPAARAAWAARASLPARGPPVSV